MFATSLYRVACGSTMRRLPCPGVTSYRVCSRPNDSNRAMSRLTARVSRFKPIANSDTDTGRFLATASRRTRSAESSRSISSEFSNETTSSGAIGSPQSSLRACSRARVKNPFTPSLVTRTLVVLFIFAPPPCLDFPLEAIGQFLVAGEFAGLHSTHEMPVVTAMAVAVSQHAPIVGAANPGIDVRQAVFHDRAAIAPNLYFQDSTPSPAT